MSLHYSTRHCLKRLDWKTVACITWFWMNLYVRIITNITSILKSSNSQHYAVFWAKFKKKTSCKSSQRLSKKKSIPTIPPTNPNQPLSPPNHHWSRRAKQQSLSGQTNSHPGDGSWESTHWTPNSLGVKMNNPKNLVQTKLPPIFGGAFTFRREVSWIPRCFLL